MGYSAEFGALTKEIVASLGGDYLAVAAQGGMHKTTLYSWAKGDTPGKVQTLVKAADGWNLTGETRTRLFHLAGFVEPKPKESGAGNGSRDVIRRTAEETARRTVSEMLSGIRFTRESPGDYFDRLLGRRFRVYAEGGLSLPGSIPRYEGGRDSLESFDEADGRLEMFDDVVRKLNPGHELPSVEADDPD